MMLMYLSLAVPSALVAAPAGTGPTACTVGSGVQTLSCAADHIIGEVTTALFGTFKPSSSCTSETFEPTSSCSRPQNVAPQVERLCKGRQNCTIGCNCTIPTGCHLDGTCGMPVQPKPPSPSPPAPPGPMPPAPKGFVALGRGSCRDDHHKEPPFYGNSAAVTLADCLSTCAADTTCTAVSFCTGPCKGSCHIYTSAHVPPARHQTWRYNAGQHGNPRNVTTITDHESFWYCYAKNKATSLVSLAPSPQNAPPPALLCACTSGELRNAVPGAPCAHSAVSVALRATCVPAGPPPSPVPPPPSTVPANLRLEFLEGQVLGLDKLKPHFSWTLPVPATARERSTPRAAQNAAEVVVRDSGTKQIWSSGKVEGSTPLLVPNLSLPLTSNRAYSWSVRVWDEGLSPSDFSAPAKFTTGLLSQADWGDAKWIIGGQKGEARMLRKEFEVDANLTADKVGRVSIFASACQYMLLYLDGVRVGDHELDVVWTKFAENRSYVTYELPPASVSPGQHVLGMELGQGFCGGSFGKAAGEGHTRAGLLRMVLHDTTAESLALATVITDSSWTVASGAVLWDSTYYGEDYDARLELDGWATPKYVPPAKTWSPATVQTHFPIDDTTRATAMAAPYLSSQLMQPIRAVQEIAPKSMWSVNFSKPCEHMSGSCTATSFVYDFGQEFAGVVRLKLPNNTKAGTNISLMYAEALAHPGLAAGNSYDGGGGALYDGRVYMKNLFWAHPEDSYVAKGLDGEVFQPHFTEHGFRYVQLTVEAGKLPEEPDLNTLVGVNYRTDSKEQARLQFGDPLLQRVSDNSRWGESAALMSIPNGAAGRGERAGWTGDSAFASESECFDFDTGAFFAQFMGQIRDGQCLDGTIGNVVPSTDPRRDGPLPYGGNCTGLTGDATWDTVYPTIAYNLLQYYGAIGVVRDHWPTLKRYVSFLELQHQKSGIKNYFCKYGDWNPVLKTPCQVTSSMSFLHDVYRMGEMAAALGEVADEKHYKTLLPKLKSEWHRSFWNPEISAYSTGTQMAQAAAIWLDDVGDGHIVPSADMHGLVQRLGDDCKSRGVTIGFVGVRYMFEALAKQNGTDAALACISRPGYPGFHYEIYNEYEPSSALWESWNVNTQKCITCETSRDHHYRAAINTFLRKYVAGLDMPPGEHGWSVIKVRPEAAYSNLNSASATIETHRGMVHTSWERDTHSGVLTLELTVPRGATGEVHVPMLHGPNTVVAENDQVLWSQYNGPEHASDSVVHTGDDGRFVRFDTLSGRYVFQVTMAEL